MSSDGFAIVILILVVLCLVAIYALIWNLPNKSKNKSKGANMSHLKQVMQNSRGVYWRVLCKQEPELADLLRELVDAPENAMDLDLLEMQSALVRLSMYFGCSIKELRQTVLEEAVKGGIMGVDIVVLESEFRKEIEKEVAEYGLLPQNTAASITSRWVKEFKKKAEPTATSSRAYLLVFHSQGCESSNNYLSILAKTSIVYNVVPVDITPSLSVKYNVMVVPSTILVDPHGRVLGKWQGVAMHALVSDVLPCAYKLSRMKIVGGTSDFCRAVMKRSLEAMRILSEDYQAPKDDSGSFECLLYGVAYLISGTSVELQDDDASPYARLVKLASDMNVGVLNVSRFVAERLDFYKNEIARRENDPLYTPLAVYNLFFNNPLSGNPFDTLGASISPMELMKFQMSGFEDFLVKEKVKLIS